MARCLGIEKANASDMIECVRAGFPFIYLQHLQKVTQLPWEKIAELVSVPQRTLARRQAEGRLHPDESDRVLRTATIVDLAVRLFDGDLPGAMQWLQTPQRALNGAKPLECATTFPGAREVENLIIRLEEGVFS